MKIDLNTSLKNNIHENSLTKIMKTSKFYYLIIVHACDEESSWLYLDFEEEKTKGVE